MCIKVSFLDTAVFIFRHDAAAMGGACDNIDSVDRADMWKIILTLWCGEGLCCEAFQVIVPVKTAKSGYETISVSAKWFGLQCWIGIGCCWWS